MNRWMIYRSDGGGIFLRGYSPSRVGLILNRQISWLVPPPRNICLPRAIRGAALAELNQPYLYTGLEASFYDEVDELSQFEDFGFYRLLLESCPGPVLDIGCGTGRILVRLKEQGIYVVGLDASSDMLRQCREKLSAKGLKAELIQGDMRSFHLPQSFASILIPGFTIQLLTEDEDLESCLQCCFQHLNPGGQLIVSTYYPWEFLGSGQESEALAFRSEAESVETQERVRAFQGWTIDREAQILQLKNRFQLLDQGGGIVNQEDREMALRWRSKDLMERMFKKAGFDETLSLYGDFEFAEPLPQAETIVFVAVRPDG